MERKTPLYDCHTAANGKIVSFAGYLLPVQYETGVIAEHMAVRTHAGLFDVSHMGEVHLSGPGAPASLERLFTNSFITMHDGQARYSPMCNERGGVVDDVLVYRFAEDDYWVVVNAANREKDVAWMKAHITANTVLEDISDNVAQLALQGPKAEEILRGLCNEALIPPKYYTFTPKMNVAGIECLVSRTGYTGEDGFELYCAPENAPALWNALLAAGAPHGLIPCGLGARDTLRLEAAMPLYGHEMDEDTTPLEAALDFAVRLKKPDFIGKAAIEERLPLTRRRVGLEITGRGIAREHCAVFADGRQIGQTTSGTHCPYLGKPVAMAILDIGFTQPGTAVEIDVRGRKVTAQVVALPFYKRA
jgi:aminomethyltransferase